jgi:purine-binding chemotaxis protein CheW
MERCKKMPVGTEQKEFEKHGSTDQQLVIFKIAGEEFGVDINEVKEIIRWEDVTRIPNTESYIKGVINLRGSIVVVNDLAMKLGLPSKEVDDDTRILVVEVESNTVGMVVDSATEVLHLDGEKVQDAPEMITSGINQNYIDGVGVLDEKRLLTLIDLSEVMGYAEQNEIIQAQQAAQNHFEEKKETKSAPSTPRKTPSKKEENTKKEPTTETEETANTTTAKNSKETSEPSTKKSK